VPVILTLTANPSIDQSVVLGTALERGGVVRSESSFEQAGGKGVNISRAAVAAGVPSIAVVPAERESAYVLELLAAGVDCRPERPSGPLRVNLTLTEPDGTTTKINSPGATADTALLECLAEAVTRRAPQADWVVLAGSLPPGAPEDWYADLATALHRVDARVAVDTSDEPLLALAGRLGEAMPDLLKPNADELAQLTGAPVSTPEEAAAAGRLLIEKGARRVLATLGSEGAVLVEPGGAWHASSPEIVVASTVGAGDACLFGYLLGDLRGWGPAERLRLAVAYGSAAAALPGTTMPAPEQVRPDWISSVSVRRLS